ncbi:MAG: hypothetical protein MJ252_18990, partial [archaeon]|nr:hypothetical protein [archaeon]
MSDPENDIYSNNELNVSNPEIVLMEKDKQIITLTKLSKDLNNQVESLTKLIQAKDYEMLNLKTEIASLQSDNKISAETIEKLNGKVKEIKEISDKKDNEILLEQQKNEEKFKDIQNTFSNHIQDYEKIVQQSQNLEKEAEVLRAQCIQKDNQISYLEQIVIELKRENKKIILLNKTIQEKDSLIINLTKQIEEEKGINQNLETEKSEINSKLDFYMNNKNALFNMPLVNPKIEQNFNNLEDLILNMKNNFKNQISDLEKQNKELKKELNLKTKENENIYESVLNQLNSFENQIDNPINSEYDYTNSTNIPNNTTNNVYNKNENPKMNLIKKKFDGIINKISEMKNQMGNQFDQSEQQINDLAQVNNELENKIMELQKINESTNYELKSMTDTTRQQKNYLEKINEKVDNFNAINEELQNQNAEYSMFKNEVDDFFNEYFSNFAKFKCNNPKLFVNFFFNKYEDNTAEKALEIQNYLFSIISSLNEQHCGM